MIDPGRLQNRELSWLDFEERVLRLAEDPSTPALERAKFLAIFSQNLDEFFQVRVAGLKEKVDAGIRKPSFDGLSPTTQLQRIGERVRELVARADAVFLDGVTPTLAEAGVRFSSWPELDADDQGFLAELFSGEVFPVLTPLAVDPAHPFPYISNLSLNLAVSVFDPIDGERRFARVKVPPLLPRFLVLPDGERFVPLEQVIAAHLGQLFPGMRVDGHVAFRVTRNADLDVEEEEAADLLAAIELEVRRRRFGRAVRLEVEAGMDAETRSLLQRELDLGDEDTFECVGPLDLGGLWTVYGLDRPDLTYPEFVPATQRALQQEEGAVDLFAQLDRRDVLVHHPYDSFATSVEELIVQASVDPAVLAVKITLYRTSGDSPIVAALIRAAEAGKQVVALVELKARFDEENNIEWARRLEQAGVHVVYGLVGLKTHSKVTLVARRAPGGEVRRYCHIGTGNYNSRTARLYEDLGLLTSDPDIGADAGELFNYLTGFARDVRFRSLLVAPDQLRDRLVELIRAERTHPDGAITMKMNSLVDPELIDELYRASADGVEVRLIVRGICCLRPGVPGLSDRISVRSLVGRYLEHSRAYHFANGGGQGRPRCYIGSADLMPRNLDRRVEVLVPVLAPDLRQRIETVLDLELSDDVLAWELQDRTWTKVTTEKGIDTQAELEALAAEASGKASSGEVRGVEA